MTWHDACHGLRDLNVHDEPRTLIRHVRDAEFVELENADACCGFGGTFSVKYPEISAAILDQKIEAIERAGVRCGGVRRCELLDADRRTAVAKRIEGARHASGGIVGQQ